MSEPHAVDNAVQQPSEEMLLADEEYHQPEEEEQMSYRMIKRKYFCYVCQKELSHMMSAYEPVNCQQCHQGFVELIEKLPAAADVGEEKKRVDETYRMTASEAARIQGNRLDLYDRHTDNLYGVPNE
jgi:DNA-directed RNA polymerase subunit RPC12/RpoP